MKQEWMDLKGLTEKGISVANYFSQWVNLSANNGGRTYQEMADLSASEMIITAYDRVGELSLSHLEIV